MGAMHPVDRNGSQMPFSVTLGPATPGSGSASATSWLYSRYTDAISATACISTTGQRQPSAFRITLHSGSGVSQLPFQHRYLPPQPGQIEKREQNNCKLCYSLIELY